ncbi:hypothetical protein LZ30DRAFT_762332, partial [Colletotrichum cereale]
MDDHVDEMNLTRFDISSSSKLSKSRLFNLCLVDKRWYKAATPSLYHAFRAGLSITFLRFLRTLIQHPDLAIYVRSVMLPHSFRRYDYTHVGAFKDILRCRALALGIPLSEHMRFWAGNLWVADIFDDMWEFLEEMLLIHTPNIVSFRLLGRAGLTVGRSLFKYLNIIARSPRQWHGMRCLRHITLEVAFPVNSPESHYMAWLSSLASVAPSVRQLSILVFTMNTSSTYPASATTHPQIPTPAHVVDFLSGLRSLHITSYSDLQSTRGTLEILIGHCKSLEEVWYRSASTNAASIVQLIRPLSPTLKRLGVTVDICSHEQTVWGGPGNDLAAVFEAIAGLTSLEVLRLDASVNPNEMAVNGVNRPNMTVSSMRALPKSLRILTITGCKWPFLTESLSQLAGLVQGGILPSFRSFNLGWDSLIRCHPFIEVFAELGVDMKMYPNEAFWGEKENVKHKAEGWMQ